MRKYAMILVVLFGLVAGLGLWRAEESTSFNLVMMDDFDGPGLDSTLWNTCHWWDDGGCTIESNDEMQWYLPSQVWVSDGRLILEAEEVDTRSPDGDRFEFRSGMITTGPPTHDAEPKFAFTYGVVEAKVKVPAGRGLWSAFWLLPADEESRPEVDIMEIIGQNPSEIIMHLHPEEREATSPSRRHILQSGDSFAHGWHTLRLEWTPSRLRFLVDDQQVWEVRGDAVPEEPMYLVANLAVGGVYPGDPDSSTVFPARYEIDFIRVEEFR